MFSVPVSFKTSTIRYQFYQPINERIDISYDDKTSHVSLFVDKKSMKGSHNNEYYYCKSDFCDCKVEVLNDVSYGPYYLIVVEQSKTCDGDFNLHRRLYLKKRKIDAEKDYNFLSGVFNEEN